MEQYSSYEKCKTKPIEHSNYEYTKQTQIVPFSIENQVLPKKQTQNRSATAKAVRYGKYKTNPILSLVSGLTSMVNLQNKANLNKSLIFTGA